MHKVSSYPNGKSIYTLMTGKTDDRELFISPLLVILDGVLCAIQVGGRHRQHPVLRPRSATSRICHMTASNANHDIDHCHNLRRT